MLRRGRARRLVENATGRGRTASFFTGPDISFESVRRAGRVALARTRLAPRNVGLLTLLQLANRAIFP